MQSASLAEKHLRSANSLKDFFGLYGCRHIIQFIEKVFEPGYVTKVQVPVNNLLLLRLPKEIERPLLLLAGEESFTAQNRAPLHLVQRIAIHFMELSEGDKGCVDAVFRDIMEALKKPQ